ncbi:MAG: metallophosphoesterase [Deltaproteobacteria bacterium]|nr:metallophosphoesterase [Deltaproteobacteria bacterium]
MERESPFRIAAIADLHYKRGSRGALREVFVAASREADVLALCGDLTDNGLPQEARVLAEDLREFAEIPVLAVLGNHDHEVDEAPAVRKILESVGVRLLDGEGVTVGGVGFAGTRGFAGGFGRWALNAWGEPVLKQFVAEAIREKEKLEGALEGLRTERRVALLHYSPVRSTCEGESLEIYPFLGSSHLEWAVDRFQVAAAFHGHAHGGSPHGQSVKGVPVYNVSLPVLRKRSPDSPPFRLVEVPPA